MVKSSLLISCVGSDILISLLMIVKQLTWNIIQKFANFGTRDYEHHSQRVNAVFETRQSLSLEGAKNIPSATEGVKRENLPSAKASAHK